MKTMGKYFGWRHSGAQDAIALAATSHPGSCKTRIIVGALLVVAILALMAHSAAAAATDLTVNLDGAVFVEPGDPSCPSGFGQDTFTFTKGVFHQTTLADGTINNTVTGEGPFSQVPLADPSVPTCNGHFAFWQGDNLETIVQNSTFTAEIQMTCTNGSRFDLNWRGILQYLDGQIHLATLTFTCH